jgi:hypothetical protein
LFLDNLALSCIMLDIKLKSQPQTEKTLSQAFLPPPQHGASHTAPPPQHGSINIQTYMISNRSLREKVTKLLYAQLVQMSKDHGTGTYRCYDGPSAEDFRMSLRIIRTGGWRDCLYQMAPPVAEHICNTIRLVLATDTARKMNHTGQQILNRLMRCQISPQTAMNELSPQDRELAGKTWQSYNFRSNP